VVIAIIGVLIALLLPAIQAAREAARRAQCTNHLKQIGIAVHNFHDTKNGLPPAGIGGSFASGTNCGFARVSFFGLVFPFLEQQGLYSYMQLRGFQYTYGGNWWTNENASVDTPMNDDVRKQFGSVSFYCCPSRRGGGAHITAFDPGSPQTSDDYRVANGGGAPYGPQGDYAIALSYQQTSDAPPVLSNAPDHWYLVYGHEVGISVNQIGPLRVALFATPLTGASGDAYKSWGPRDTMAWWTDGSSNQIILGEKHLPPVVLDRCLRGDVVNLNSYGEDLKYSQLADCSYLVGGEVYTVTMGRYVRVSGSNSAVGSSDIATGARELAILGSERATVLGSTYGRFGSAHPDVVNFLFGDGSVHALPLSLPAKILACLGTVNDGNTVVIP